MLQWWVRARSDSSSVPQSAIWEPAKSWPWIHWAAGCKTVPEWVPPPASIPHNRTRSRLFESKPTAGWPIWWWKPSGHQQQALNLCIDLCRQGGQILYFGLPPQRINGVNWRALLAKNITVYTSIGPDVDRDFPLAMRWIAEGRIDVEPLITHRFPVRQIQQAFDTFREKRDGALKVMIDFPSRSTG